MCKSLLCEYSKGKTTQFRGIIVCIVLKANIILTMHFWTNSFKMHSKTFKTNATCLCKSHCPINIYLKFPTWMNNFIFISTSINSLWLSLPMMHTTQMVQPRRNQPRRNDLTFILFLILWYPRKFICHINCQLTRGPRACLVMTSTAESYCNLLFKTLIIRKNFYHIETLGDFSFDISVFCLGGFPCCIIRSLGTPLNVLLPRTSKKTMKSIVICSPIHTCLSASKNISLHLV